MTRDADRADDHDRRPGEFTRKPATRTRQVYQPAARSLLDEIIASRPDLAESRYLPVIAAWAESTAVVLLLRRHLAEVGVIGPAKPGSPEETEGIRAPRDSLLRTLSAAEHRAAQAAKELGIGPRAEAELALARAETRRTAVDISAILARADATMTGTDASIAATADVVDRAGQHLAEITGTPEADEIERGTA